MQTYAGCNATDLTARQAPERGAGACLPPPPRGPPHPPLPPVPAAAAAPPLCACTCPPGTSHIKPRSSVWKLEMGEPVLEVPATHVGVPLMCLHTVSSRCAVWTPLPGRQIIVCIIHSDNVGFHQPRAFPLRPRLLLSLPFQLPQVLPAGRHKTLETIATRCSQESQSCASDTVQDCSHRAPLLP